MLRVGWRQEIWLPVRLGYIWGAKRFGTPTLRGVFCFFVLFFWLEAWNWNPTLVVRKSLMSDSWWESWLCLGVTLIRSLNCVSYIRRHFLWQFSAFRIFRPLESVTFRVWTLFWLLFLPWCSLNYYLLQMFDLWHHLWFTSSKIGTYFPSSPLFIYHFPLELHVDSFTAFFI